LNHNSQIEYDIIVIGAGVSGLMSASLFGRLGYRVCVLEMDARPGGYIAGFNRLDYRFDSAIHWLNQCGKNGLVTQAFNFIGTDYPKASIQHKIRKYHINEYQYLITTDVDAFKRQLQKDFPEDSAGIERFFKDARKIGRSFENFRFINRNMSTMNLLEKANRGIQMLRFVIPFIPHVRFSGDEGVKKGLKRYFTNPKLLELFGSEPDLLSCLIPIAWTYIQDYQTPPRGGSQMFAEWLAHVSESYGNEVRFKSKVSKILLENNKAVGVEYEHRGQLQQVRGRYVIAACDVKNLYEKYLPKEITNPDLLKRLDNAELYASAFTLSLALDCTGEELGFGEEILYIADPTITRERLGNGDPETSGMHVISGAVRDKSLAPEGKGTLTIFIPSFIEQYENWGTKLDEKGNFTRGADYKETKQKVADVLIDRLERELNIDLRSHIVYLDIATPITHQRYTGNRNGTMMGARPGKSNMQAKVAHYKTPVPNVFLSGHWAELGGGIPVAVRAALNSTLLVLKQENKPAFKLLADYMDGKTDVKAVQQSPLVKPYANDWVQKPTPAEKQELKTNTKSEY
jgi:phytoene dehydrogenase-like protein